MDTTHPSEELRESSPIISFQSSGCTSTHSDASSPTEHAKGLFSKLSISDRLLTPAILIAMILGVVIGVFAPGVQDTFDTVKLNGVSAPIAIGLIAMMWPILTKVQYETFPALFTSQRLWTHIILSIFLNWIIGPFIMLGLAWATLPDLPTYRTGVIMVGLARCIAMVMIWNQLAGGDGNYCAILVMINSILQIILYSPFAVLFINIIGNQESSIHVSYGKVAISVLIYLGIPLVAGAITRYGVWLLTSKRFLNEKFLPLFGYISLLGLLYTIIVMFAYQGHQIIHNLGPVFRTMVPLMLYFAIMWTSAFWVTWRLSVRYPSIFGYEMAVVQSFTAGSNNFELAIAVAIAVYGIDSDQALAATIGPLVEVPTLLILTWVSLFLHQKLAWSPSELAEEHATEKNS